MKNTTVGTYGLITLMITLIITKLLTSAPSLYARHSYGAGWLEVLISGLFEALVLCIVLKLFLKFDNLDLIDISEKILGKIGRVFVGLISIFIFSISSAAILRSFAEMIRNTAMRGMMYEYLVLAVFITGTIGALLGIRTIANLNGLILPVLIISVVVILAINFSRLSILNISPFLGRGGEILLYNSICRNSTFYEIGTILFLTPYIREKAAVKKIGFTALLVSVFLSTLIALFYQLSVPYEAAGTFSYPFYQMTRMLKAGTFFQRIEPLNIFIWGGCAFVYVSFGIWLCSDVFKKTFNLSDRKPTVYLFATIVCFFALIPGSETSVERIFDFLITYACFAYPLFPAVLLIFACILKRKRCVE